MKVMHKVIKIREMSKTYEVISMKNRTCGSRFSAI